MFDRFAARLSYISGDFGDEETFERLAAAIHDAHAPVFYLEIPPFLFGNVVKGLSDAGLTHGRARRRREAVRPRPRVGPCAGRRDPSVHRRVPAVPHRPLPREDGRGGDPLPALRQRRARADLDAPARLLDPDHHGRELRRRGSRPLLRPGRRAARRRGQPPHAGRRRRHDGGAVQPATRTRSRTRCTRCSARSRRPTPPTTCAASTTATATSTGVAADSTTETYAALRLDIDNWRWSGVPIFIRTGKRMPVTQTELRLVFERPPRVGFHAACARASPSRCSS